MARILREKFIDHLQRISAGGMVKEAVFTGAFGANALTPDHLLLVVAPELDGMEPLPNEVGVGDLKKLISAVGMIGGSGDETADVDVSFHEHRIVIDESARNAQLKLVTANPQTIATRVKPDTVQKLIQKAAGEGAASVAISVDLMDDVRKAFAGLKADTVQLVFTPMGGHVKVGGGNTDGAEFFVPSLVGEERTLNFGQHLIEILGVVTGDVVLKINETGTMIVIEDDGFVYLLSAKAAGATAKKPAVKAATKGAAAEQPADGDALPAPPAAEESQPRGARSRRPRPQY